mgnify:FL=1
MALKVYVRGDDWDLEAALEENPECGAVLDDVMAVLAVVYGEHDESDYYWILRLKDGRYGLLQGRHDYSGWDCQSYAQFTRCLTPADAVEIIDEAEDTRPIKSFLHEQLNGVPPEKSAHQMAAERMGFKLEYRKITAFN